MVNMDVPLTQVIFHWYMIMQTHATTNAELLQIVDV